MTTVYTAEVVSDGDGRNGIVHSDDGRLDLKLTAPGAPGGTNPEQLFAAGYAACFHSALRLSAREAGITLPDSRVHATVRLLRGDDGYRLAAELVAELPGTPTEVADRLVQQAHGRCPYSRAVAGNIEVIVRQEGPAR
ncbi:organic hydroperoxide resistance protein [Paractinoplanes ferrugineus]|uniref:Organic hydroperoxide resistance protein n=1 Tax=Paractinoplanes ferrugineus TaxID=113564 RepID=A0A919J3C7_9ACTN|nr:Ohr family peroxiredoxin [Actinoplanes ferrugineus]GIE13193.1 organic hydroperoxide resistance protein [Actinoplanes ferrugineus]